MYCTKCGKENDNSNTFCGYCGNKFERLEDLPLPVSETANPKTAEMPSPAPSAVTAAGVQPEKKQNAGMVLVLLLAVALAAAAMLVQPGRAGITDETTIAEEESTETENEGIEPEEVKIAEKKEMPTVTPLCDKLLDNRFYCRIPYISNANNKTLNDFNKYMSDVKNDVETRSVYIEYDVDGWSDVRYAATADGEKIQVLFYFETYNDHIFRSYNYDFNSGEIEKFDKIEKIVDKKDVAKKINKYLDETYGADSYARHHTSAEEIIISGYVEDANKNKLIYLRCDTWEDYSPVEIYFLDTSDGSINFEAEMDDIFNAFLDTERFPNAVDPIIYNSKEDE